MACFHNRVTECSEDLSGPIAVGWKEAGHKRRTRCAGPKHPAQLLCITLTAGKTGSIVERLSQSRRAEQASLMVSKHEGLQLARVLETCPIELCKHLFKSVLLRIGSIPHHESHL